MHGKQRYLIVLVITFFLLSSITWSQQKKSLTHDVYDSWKSIYQSKLSPDGNWILYLETPQDGEAEVVVIKLSGVKEMRHTIGYSGEGTDSERAADAQFSYDCTHAVFLISPSKEEIEEAKDKKKEKKKEPKKKLGIMSLLDGNTDVTERVKSFKLPEEAGGWVAYLKEAPEKQEKEQEEKKKEKEQEGEKKEEQKKDEEEDKKEKEYGTPLVLRSLEDGSEVTVDSVMEYRFTKEGQYLIYTVSSEEKPETDGVYILKPGRSSSIPLLTGEGNYKKLAIDKEGTHLAFLTDRDDYDADEPTFNLYGWDVGTEKASLWVSHRSIFFY